MKDFFLKHPFGFMFEFFLLLVAVAYWSFTLMGFGLDSTKVLVGVTIFSVALFLLIFLDINLPIRILHSSSTFLKKSILKNWIFTLLIQLFIFIPLFLMIKLFFHYIDPFLTFINTQEIFDFSKIVTDKKLFESITWIAKYPDSYLLFFCLFFCVEYIFYTLLNFFLIRRPLFLVSKDISNISSFFKNFTLNQSFDISFSSISELSELEKDLKRMEEKIYYYKEELSAKSRPILIQRYNSILSSSVNDTIKSILKLNQDSETSNSKLTNEIENLKDTLKSFSRYKREIHFQTNDIIYDLRSIINQFKEKYPRALVQFKNEYKQLIFDYDSDAIKRAINILLDNAVKEMKDIPRIVISLTKGSYLFLIIQDGGYPVRLKEKNSLFLPNIEKYISTKRKKLDLLDFIISKHNGFVLYNSKEGFTQFYITLPLHQEESDEL